jgi:hypothetical protein
MTTVEDSVIRMWRQDFGWAYIASSHGITRAQVEYIIDAHAHKARDDRSITAKLCGDPLPGRSALDKLRRPMADNRDSTG